MAVPEQNLPVSAVVCAYNAEKYLEKSLQSICNQTYRNLEIIVIDDASTDATADIVRRLSDSDHRIHLVRLETNGGIAHARQIGLEIVSNDWLLFLDADDIALPSMIEKQVQVLQNDKDVIGVSTYSYFFGENENEITGEQRIGVPSKEEFFEKFSKGKLIFLLITTLFSKKHALAVGGYRLHGFPRNSPVRYQDFSEDVDLWCRLSDYGAEGKYLVTIPEPLFKYRKTIGSLSTTNIFRMQEKMRWIKDCLRCRRKGQPERLFEEYRRSITTMQKISNIRSDYAALIYRKMGFFYMEKQYCRAILFFAIVGILDPRFALQKLKTQKRAG